MQPVHFPPTGIPDGSSALRVLFSALAILVAAGFVVAVFSSALRAGVANARRQGVVAALGATAWLVITGAAAAAGVLSFSGPTMFITLGLSLALAVGIAFSPLGLRIAVATPIAALVGFQAFRIGVELLMHQAYVEGLMPVQMSFSGRNFDIVTGSTAVLAALWLARRPSNTVLFLWNTLGSVLLANILVVALLSAPTPLRVFMNEPANVWISRAPWVWLPTVMVVAALAGHLVIYRRLWVEARGRMPVLRTLAAASTMALLVLGACRDATEPPPPPFGREGTVAGSVTLLGPDVPATPVGTTISLYESIEHLWRHDAAYTVALTPDSQTISSYFFVFPLVKPGMYVARACFLFGCAEHRHPATGALIPIAVAAGRLTHAALRF